MYVLRVCVCLDCSLNEMIFDFKRLIYALIAYFALQCPGAIYGRYYCICRATKKYAMHFI